jgi:cytochrome c
MDSWEFTKIAAAVLSALLIIFGTKTAVEIASASHGKQVVGYVLPVKDAPVAAGGASTDAGAAAGAGLSFAKVAELLQKASADAGAGVFKKCASCHTVTKGGANAVGPNLWGIVNRQKASHPGFNYSEAARGKAAEQWSFENLTKLINNTRGYLPGTKMVFGGISDPVEMADLMAYLRTLSDAPVALPN